MHTPMEVRIPIRKSKKAWVRKLVRSTMLTAIPLLVGSVAAGAGAAGTAGATLGSVSVLLLLLLLLLHAAGAICKSMRPITRERITTCCNFNMAALWVFLNTDCNCTLVNAWFAPRVILAKCYQMFYILRICNYCHPLPDIGLLCQIAVCCL